MSKKSIKSRNHTVGVGLKNLDESQNVTVFPNVLSSDIYIDSDDRIEGTVSDCIYENRNNIVDSQVTRLGLKFIDFYFKIPNSNGRNNAYKFMIVGSPVEITFELPIKNYLSSTDLFLDLKSIMELSALAQTGLVYTIDFPQVNNGVYYNVIPNIPTRFINSNGITFGNNLHGLYYTDGYFNTINIIPKLYYTRYVDVLFTEITDAKTLPHKFSARKKFNTSEHLTRLYIPFSQNGGFEPLQITGFQKENTNINFYAYRHRDVNSFRIKLFDEFQEFLYVETQNVSTVDPVSSIVSEIPYVKYNLVLSVVG